MLNTYLKNIPLRFGLLLVGLASLAGCATTSLGSGNISIDAEAAWEKQPEVFEALNRQVHKEWSRNITMKQVKAPPGTTVTVVIQVFADGGEPYPMSIRGGNRKSRQACAQAVMVSIYKTIKTWTPEMIDDLGEKQTLTFTFVYS